MKSPNYITCFLSVFDLSDDDEWETDEEDDEEDHDSTDDEGSQEFMFGDCETKTRFTEYSMTSSVMRRNEQLTLLDDCFEKVKQENAATDTFV